MKDWSPIPQSMVRHTGCQWVAPRLVEKPVTDTALPAEPDLTGQIAQSNEPDTQSSKA